ncbi:hypothetical protein FRC02_000777 [Tulasnella sp. 418]|nr:hypothetical protein FRC02_000777 [Tulasnella sp. 418]
MYHLPPFLYPLICFFRESMHPPVRFLVLDFITAFSAPMSIIILESMRHRGWLGIGTGFLVGMTSQLLGAGVVTHLYWLNYVVGFQTGDTRRPIKRRFVKSVLGAITVGMIAPIWSVLIWDDSPNVHALFQVFPVVVAALQVVFALFEASQYRSAQEEKDEDDSKDSISLLVNVIYWACAGAHVYSIANIANSPSPLQALITTFLPSATTPVPPSEDLKLRTIAMDFLQWDYVLSCISCFIALIWTHEGASIPWISIVKDIALFGPGAALIGLWGERERVWKQEGKIHAE